MKNYALTIAALLLAVSYTGVQAQTSVVYHDAAAFPLLGKATEQTATRYERLPDSLQNKIRQPLWNLGTNSAGLSIRFCSNSTTIAARWEVRQNFRMNHMTDTGVKGLDLYTLVDGVWRFAGSGRPTGKTNKATLIAHMEPEMREYMLFLPLYDGVTSLEIGVDSLSIIDQPQAQTPTRDRPIVAYGTSILQGGCASRPGMAHTNILQRWLNREIINLGFSGNALLDYEIAEVLADVPDPLLYILDFVPNANAQQMRERMTHFVEIIRDKHPTTPILFVEDPVFPHALFDEHIAQEIQNKNEMLHTVYNELLAAGERHALLLSSRDAIGTDGEATVDGVHFTDLGFIRYARLLLPVIQQMTQLP